VYHITKTLLISSSHSFLPLTRTLISHTQNNIVRLDTTLLKQLRTIGQFSPLSILSASLYACVLVGCVCVFLFVCVWCVCVCGDVYVKDKKKERKKQQKKPARQEHVRQYRFR